MAKKKKNAIIEEQRRAREEFLKLKKMQSGEMQAPPKPSEIAIVPKTPLEKLKNIWFHDKWYILGGLFAAVVIAVMVAQCATREKYDLKAVIFTYEIVAESNCEPIAEYLEQYCEDIDGDGEVNIQVINCSYNKGSNDMQYQNSMSQKLTAILAADADALLFITDDESYEYLNGVSKDNKVFEGDPVKLGEKFYEECTVEDALSHIPENLQISCRAVSGKTIEKDDNIKEYYEQSQKILEGIKKETENS